MSDESEPATAVAKAVEETGKAVQEVAKTGRALIEPGTDLAKYVARCLGTVPEDVIEFLIGGPLRELRQHTLTGILCAVFEKLRKRGVETAKPIRPGPGKEAFEAASLATDETLQDMWAELLANAMDPSKDTSLQRIFIEALGQMEPIDALVFRTMAEKAPNEALGSQDLAKRLACRETLASVSAGRLADLGILRDIGTPGRPVYDITALGMELNLACQSDAPD